MSETGSGEGWFSKMKNRVMGNKPPQKGAVSESMQKQLDQMAKNTNWQNERFVPEGFNKLNPQHSEQKSELQNDSFDINDVNKPHIESDPAQIRPLPQPPSESSDPKV